MQLLSAIEWINNVSCVQKYRSKPQAKQVKVYVVKLIISTKMLSNGLTILLSDYVSPFTVLSGTI